MAHGAAPAEGSLNAGALVVAICVHAGDAGRDARCAAAANRQGGRLQGRGALSTQPKPRPNPRLDPSPHPKKKWEMPRRFFYALAHHVAPTPHPALDGRVAVAGRPGADEGDPVG